MTQEFAQPRKRVEKQAASDIPQVHRQTSVVDSILDEIDSALETNAESFIQGFIQKGGQRFPSGSWV